MWPLRYPILQQYIELFLFSYRIQKNIHSPQPHLELASHLSRHLSKTKTQIRMSAGATSQRWTKTLVPLLHLYKVKIHRLLQYRKILKVWGLGKVGLDGVLMKYGDGGWSGAEIVANTTYKSHLTLTALLGMYSNKIISKRVKINRPDSAASRLTVKACSSNHPSVAELVNLFWVQEKFLCEVSMVKIQISTLTVCIFSYWN